jgi:hypothetical protein
MEARPLKPCKEVLRKRQETGRQKKEDEDTRENKSEDEQSAEVQNSEPFSAASTGEECAPSSATAPEAAELEDYACQTRQAHPIQTFRIHIACLFCARDRAQRLRDIEEWESGNGVRFEDWRWKVKYHSPVPEGSRYIQPELGSPGEWSEAMGSWVQGVKGRASGLGLVDLGGGISSALRETGSEVVKDGLKKERVKDEGGVRVGFRGNIPSS